MTKKSKRRKTEPTIFETGVSTEKFDELYEQMADYARANEY